MDMDETQRQLRKVQLAGIQTALQAALEDLDDLDRRAAEKQSRQRLPVPTSRLANQIALGMNKAGLASYN